MDAGRTNGSTRDQSGAFRGYRISEKTSGNDEGICGSKTKLLDSKLRTGPDRMERV